MYSRLYLLSRIQKIHILAYFYCAILLYFYCILTNCWCVEIYRERTPRHDVIYNESAMARRLVQFVLIGKSIFKVLNADCIFTTCTDTTPSNFFHLDRASNGAAIAPGIIFYYFCTPVLFILSAALRNQYWCDRQRVLSPILSSL